MQTMTVEAAEALAVVRALEAAGIRYVLSGGWGIDALVGVQTRAHSDLDVGVDAGHVDDIIRLLGTLGYAATVDQRPARVELRAADGRAVDLHPIEWDADGNGRQRGFAGKVYFYPDGSTVVGRIAGERVACVSDELQLEFHSGYESTERDRVDLAALKRQRAELQLRP